MMLNQGSFLTPDEYDDFTTSERSVLRSIVEVSLDNPDAPSSAPVPLVKYVLDRLKALPDRAQPFESLCIQVRKDDGMTWSAEAVNTAVRDRDREQYGDRPGLCVAPDLMVDALPLGRKVDRGNNLSQIGSR